MFNQGRINIHIEHNTKPNDSLVVSSNICITAVLELFHQPKKIREMEEYSIQMAAPDAIENIISIIMEVAES